jgi:hypothetical protein
VTCRRSTKILGLANAFSGGLFMGIALFHLLPESAENFEKHFEGNNLDSVWKRLPTPFFIAFISYSLILFVEKIAFDSHSITEHDHGGHLHSEHHSHDTKYPDMKGSELSEPLLEISHNDEEKEKIKIEDKASKVTPFGRLEPIKEHENDKNSKMLQGKNYENEDLDELLATRNRQNSKKSLDSQNYLSASKKYLLSTDKHKKKELGYEEEDEEDFSLPSDDEDNDEQTMKNVVSSKGKFASYLQARNLCKYLYLNNL